ncbi:MAG: myo-inosose-2 dehydratase [Mesorhizobium sp.]|nr:myo-inosose-2 dehydratase [Mesorhizobium sp.]MBL8578810.1 myo-inosose-2 dehydratase [Mesorhizobium sp.]
MTVRIGINPITWTNDDVPELGGDTPLETCLTETALAGYRGTELGGKFPRQSSELGPILSSHGLELVSGWYDGRILDREVEEEFDAILPHLTLLRDLGARHVVYADTSRGRHDAIHAPISQRPRLADDEWAAYGRKITALAERFSDFGVAMAFHHHMGTIVETDAEIDRFMASTGEAVGLLFDTGHCLFSGGNPYTLLSRHIARVVHFHCKDVRKPVLDKARAQDMSFMAAVMEGIFTVPGDGSVDFPALLRPLAESGYSGWLVVEAEQDPARAHPLTYATKGYRSLLASALGAGFTVETREGATVK